MDQPGYAHITGVTFSEEGSFPVTVGPDLTNADGDAFVAKLDPSGTSLVYAGYIGGAGDGADLGTAVELDGLGNAYVAGFTQSSELPVIEGPDLSYHGGRTPSSPR